MLGSLCKFLVIGVAVERFRKSLIFLTILLSMSHLLDRILSVVNLES